MNLPTIATHLAALSFYGHSAHLRITGPTFFADHEWLDGYYKDLRSAFDTTAELALGNKETLSPGQTFKSAADQAAKWEEIDGGQPVKMLSLIAQQETRLQTLITQANSAYPTDLGTQNHLAQLHQDSKHRANYLLAHRLK